MKRSEYDTLQKQRLLAFLREHKTEQFTVGRLTAELGKGSDTAPGRSTVYRQIGHLCAEGIVRRFEQTGSNSFVYQYADTRADCDGEAHFHLKCVHCGRLIHLECDRLAAVRKHIQADHGFRIGSARGILWGECDACLAGEGAQ